MPLKRLYIVIILILSFASFQVKAFAVDALSWQDCIKEAAKNNPDLIAAGEEIKQSQAGKTITASALYPQIDAGVTAATARSDNGVVNSDADSYGYGLSATQLIFDGTKTIQDVKAAGQNIQAAKEGFRFTSATVRYRLRLAFVDLLRAQELLRITEEIYNIRRGNLELITLRYESGLEHKGALLTAEADLSSAQYGISQNKRDLEVSQRNLTKEMGRKELAPLEAKGSFEVSNPAKDKPDFLALVKNNPSLQQLIAQKNAAQFSLRSAYANFSPTLSGSAAANKAGSHWPPKNDQWDLGLALSLPVFEGGLRLAQVAQARALLNQLRENERSTQDSLVLALEQTWAELQDAIENVEVQRKSLLAAQERSNIAQAQYSIGFISFDNWTIIEDNLVSAKRNFLEAQANALFAEAAWIQAKGETLEHD
jgi:outer membrane protein TolC